VPALCFELLLKNKMDLSLFFVFITKN